MLLESLLLLAVHVGPHAHCKPNEIEFMKVFSDKQIVFACENKSILHKPPSNYVNEVKPIPPEKPPSPRKRLLAAAMVYAQGNAFKLTGPFGRKNMKLSILAVRFVAAASFNYLYITQFHHHH